MSYTNGLDNPQLYFQTKLYTGNGSTQSITFDGSENMQPDWVWVKQRSGTTNHKTSDSVRGATKALQPNDVDAEATDSNGITSFDSNGFSLGNGGDYNGSSNNFVSWNWLASGSTASNSDGSITSTVSANTTAGFSIVSYTGNGTTNATVGHGLGVEPKAIWFKRRDSSNNWINYFSALGTGHYLTLNLNGAQDSASGAWCTPSSTTFQLNQVFSATNTNTATYIAYCFAEKQGYSKIGSYEGTNSSSNGAFVYTGFKPAFMMVKNIDAAKDWNIYDSARDIDNPLEKKLEPNTSDAESTDLAVDFVANGFKFRQNGSNFNDANTYVYIAFAESPFVTSSGVPACAR